MYGKLVIVHKWLLIDIDKFKKKGRYTFGNLPKRPAKLANRGLHVGSDRKTLGKNSALTSNISTPTGRCMPTKRDPFADKRKTSNGIPPKQAKRKREVKRVMDTRKIPKATRELNALKKEMSSTEKKLAVKQQLLEMMSQAPTPAQQRKMVLAMFEDAGFNPLQALIEFVTEKDETGEYALPVKERIAVTKELSGFFAAKPKTIDLQADVQSNMTVNVVDFSKTTQKDLVAAAMAAEEAPDAVIDVSEEPDYSEFTPPEATASVTENDGSV